MIESQVDVFIPNFARRFLVFFVKLILTIIIFQWTCRNTVTVLIIMRFTYKFLILTKIGTNNDLKNLQFLSGEVFVLDEEYQIILKHLLRKKQPEKGATLTSISKFTQNANEEFSRRLITKRLRGSPRRMGLVPYEYLYEKKENTHRYCTDETTFHLRFKGMLATLSLDYSLDEIYLYKEYLNYLTTFVNDRNLMKLIDKFFKIEVHLFLFLHFIYGINLTKLISVNSYFLRSTIQLNSNLSKEHIRKTDAKILNEIIESYNTTRKIFKLIELEPLPLAFISFIKSPDEANHEPIYIDDPDLPGTPAYVESYKPDPHPYKQFIRKLVWKGLGALVYEWPRMMEKYNLEKDNFSIERMIPKFHSKKTNQTTEDSEFVDNAEIKKQLNKFGIDY